MFKVKQKITTIWVACLTALFALVLAIGGLFAMPNTTASAAETTETLSISGGTGTLASDSLSISWTSGSVTFTNNKGSSTTAIRTSDSDHYRVYAKSTVEISVSEGSISQIVITCTSSSYATTCQTSATNAGATTTVSGSVVTITPADSAQKFTFTATAQIRLNKVEVTYTEASTEPACTHEGFETTWVYDSATNEHYQQCVNCEAEIENTRAACSEFTYGDYTTVDGVHTRTVTCTVCSGEQTESGECEVTAEYVREGDSHTQTGTCSICQASTTVTAACTLSYENVSNGDKTHNMTSSCSVCNQSVTTENVACTFNDGVLDGTTLTYTCEYCAYSYTEEATMYTVTYVVPDGVEAVVSVEVAENFTTALPTAGTVDGYTFVGWTTGEYTANTASPETVYTEGEEYTVTEDVKLYALYTYTEGETEESWNLATATSQLSAGKQIVIVASDSAVALSTTQNTNNRTAVAVTKSNDNSTVTIDKSVQIIALEAGNVDGTFAFNVGDGYLYAASSSSNYLRTETTLSDNSSWLITITEAGIATIKAQGTNSRNWLRYNTTSTIFACYASGQNDVSIYVKTGGTTVYYTTSFNVCEHTNTTEETTPATCTETGVTRYICDDCGTIVSEEELSALGHNYVDGFCTNAGCGEQDPETITYEGYYYFAVKRSSGNYFYISNAWDSSKDRYVATDSGLTELGAITEIDMSYVFYVVKNANGTYNIYEANDGEAFGGNVLNVTITKNENGTYGITDTEGVYFSFNNTTGSNYIKWYTSTQVREISFLPVDLSAKINQATLTIGEDLKLNYYVSMSETFASAQMTFTMGENSEIVEGVKNGDYYVFSFAVAPNQIAENVAAELKFNDMVIASKAEYSVKAYAQNMLNQEISDELKQLLTDLLYYGDAAYNYVNETTDETPATADVANIGTASTATPATNDFNLANSELPEGVESYGAWFTGATVWFGDTNKIVVKLSTTENVTLTVNGVEVAVTGTTIYMDALLATEFDTVYTFVLSYDGVEMQTLTYSVNAYAYAMQGTDTNMGKLALALYRYGESAKAYKNSLVA
ncbi:MAG: InlB B-repeat-containing protein [Clostridia bacterium]|nr:InlB B-repeat-containing protein [Clostridia bacterium]